MADGGIERVRHDIAVEVHASYADFGDVERQIGEWLWFWEVGFDVVVEGKLGGRHRGRQSEEG